MTKLDQNNSVPATQTINYAIVFLGGATEYTEHTASVSSLQSCLDAALTQAGPNKLLSQYYGGSTVSATSFTSTNPCYVETTLSTPCTRGDLLNAAQYVVTNYKALGLSQDPSTSVSFVLIMVLPPGFTLVDDNMLPGHSALSGIHGRFDGITGGATSKVYFCASPWGPSPPDSPSFPQGWADWQQTCAILYKEIAQYRTNPDVNDLLDTGPPTSTNGWASWVPQTSGTSIWAEVGNLTALNGGVQFSTSTVYNTVSVTTSAGPAPTTVNVPVHALWSNAATPPNPVFPSGS